MHIVSHTNDVYFIASVYNICVVCSSEWTLDTDVVTPWSARHGTGKGKGNTSGFPVFKYDKFINQFLIKHAISPLSVHYLGLNMN